MSRRYFLFACKVLISFFMLFTSTLWAQHEHHMMSSADAMSSKKNQNNSNHLQSNINAKQKSKIISQPQGSNRIVNLVIEYKRVNFAGKWRRAIAVNNQIPAPTLHFKEGDHVTINVYNHLDQGTAIHWHGVLVPWQMDGVEHVTQHAIPPGEVLHYQFTLHQAGTYWYHAHAEAQEQDGVYGALIIDPSQAPTYHYNKDQVIVLSDWSNALGAGVLANLKKDGDYYSPKFPLQPSLMKFIHDYKKADSEERKKLIDDYKMMQQMRMSIYDFSDVAYDAYLLNGQAKSNPWTALVKIGDVVRLRFIGAAGSTIYRVKIPGAKMEIVHVQGNDVNPYFVDDFSIAPGETYDVLVKIQKHKPYIIYAESIDTLGKAFGALITDPHQAIPYDQVKPFPEPPPITREMMDNMMMSMEHGHNSMSMHMGMQHHMGMSNTESNMDHQSMQMNTKSHQHSSMPSGHDHHAMMMKDQQKNNSATNTKQADTSMSDHAMSMNHTMNHSMTMPTEPTIIGDTLSPPNSYHAMTMGTKYQDLQAAVQTNDPNKPIANIIRMELFGYMNHFIWFINGLPEYRAKPIVIEPNKRYRIIFINNSMMHHPMHIHLHWFILRNGHGAYDPLLHTIDVPPGATVVADVDADASGQAFFHCHHLYHMMTGMARVFQYSTILQIVNGEAPPQNITTNTNYANRPIVRQDAVIPIDPTLVVHPRGHHAGFYWANFLDVGEDPFNNVQRLTFEGLYGPDYNKLELFMNDAEMKDGTIENADLDIFYWHLISQFWAIKGGANYFYRPAENPYWQPGIGLEGLMPFFINTDLRSYYHNDSAKFDIDLFRDTQITNNFFIRAEIRSIIATKTVEQDEIGSGLNQMRYIIRPFYRIMPGWAVFVEYEHEQAYGELEDILRSEGKPSNENTVTFGLSLIF